MPRFGDRWVVDRTVFEFVNGGSCSCAMCFSFLPGGTKDMIQAMSDLETDAANAEISALARSPWPPNMRDQVWSDRLKLRHLMKKEMPNYQQFWEQHAVQLEEWCQQQDATTLQRIFQMPRSEVTERVRNHYVIHSAFAAVISTVVEQVSNFPVTQLPTDARGESEVAFEEALKYDRRGGFMLPIKSKDGNINQDVLQTWLQRMKTLGGPKLLERAPKKRVVDDSDDEGDGGDADDGGLKKVDDDDEPPANSSAEPSFRADRRIIRLLIARYWADQMMTKFLADHPDLNNMKEEVDDNAEKEGDNTEKEKDSL